jgi:hypothetical protein
VRCGAEVHTWVEPHSIHRGFVRADSDRVARRVDKLVALPQMVLLWRLVKHVGDHAVELRAERIVRRLVRKTARGEKTDGGRLPIRGTGHLQDNVMASARKQGNRDSLGSATACQNYWLVLNFDREAEVTLHGSHSGLPRTGSVLLHDV